MNRSLSALALAASLGTAFAAPTVALAQMSSAGSVAGHGAAAPSDAGPSRALALAKALQEGSVDHAQLAPSLAAIFDRATEDGYRDQLTPLGAPTKAVLRAKVKDDTATRYVYRIYFPGATADLTFALDDGTYKISALYLRPGPPL